MVTTPIVAKAAGEASKALTGDIVTAKTQFFREVEIGKGKGKQKVLVPVDIEAHLNPLSILLGGAALGVAAVASVIAWNGITLRALGGEFTLLKGLKDMPFFDRLATSARLKLSERARGGFVIDGRFVANPTDDQICAELRRRRDDTSRPREDRNRAVKQAEQRGCEWAVGSTP